MELELGLQLWLRLRLWGMCGRRVCKFSFVCFRCFSYFCKLKNVFMNRVKWILLGVCLFGMLIGAAVAYSGYVKKRLDADGAETRAVLTASFSRTECVGYRPGYRGRTHRNFREKRTVYYFRYRFRVGGTDYTGKVRKTENLMTARIGDSVVVRYLPDDPDVHRLVRSEGGKYRVIRPRPRSCARRSAS